MNIAPKSRLFGLMLLAATPGSAEELGRLFFTPEQRAQLEQSQQQDNKGNSLTVNGIVQRQGGVRTVWINGVPQLAGTSDERAPESAPVLIPGRAMPVKLKVGQKVQYNQSVQEK